MKLLIDGKKYETKTGDTILDVCRNNGIPISTLCNFDGLPREQVCRLCLVEINKSEKLVTACTFQVCEGLEVITQSEKVAKARKINMELLWADHGGKCSSCTKNLRCELQKMAQDYQIENFHFIPRKGEITSKEELDLIRDNKSRAGFVGENPAIKKNGELCVECRRCINICPTKEWGFNYRGFRATVSTPYNQKLDCMMCGQCLKVCPTASLDDDSDIEAVRNKINDPSRFTIAIVDPQIIESLRLEIPDCASYKNAEKILLKLGFEKIFNLADIWDKYIDSLSREVKIAKEGVYWLSCCPALNWQMEHNAIKINMISIDQPETMIIENIISNYLCKKRIDPEITDIFLITPCTNKRAFPNPKITGVLSIRELGRLHRLNESNHKSIRNDNKKFDFDTARLSLQPGKIISEIKRQMANQDNTIFQSVSGWEEINKLFKSIREKKGKKIIIEGWVCPDGCVNGDGQARRID